MMTRLDAWRLLWLVPAGLFLAGAVQQVVAHRKAIASLRLPRAKIPPTMYGEHLGMAVTLACLGLACLILALRPQRPAA